MPTMSEFSLASSNGFSKLRVLLCEPDSAPRGVVQIAHGIAEHIACYEPFMRFLAEQGFVAVGNDHLGHGKSVSVPEELGVFAEKDGWQLVLDDLAKLRRRMVESYPGLPYVLFGHSMGSFLARSYAIQHPNDADYLILCGTGQQPDAMIRGGELLAKAAPGLLGAKRAGKFLNKLAFGSYNKQILKPKTPFDWLNRDGAEVAKYMADPLCGFAPSPSMFRDMMGGLRFISDRKNVARMNRDTPVLLIAGDQDPVGEYGAGVERVYRLLCDAGLHRVFLKFYRGARHELLLEQNRAEVFEDVLHFITTGSLSSLGTN